MGVPAILFGKLDILLPVGMSWFRRNWAKFCLFLYDPSFICGE
jgi:hypothetical protein